MDETLLVLTNAPDETVAQAIAENLVASRAAACVNCLAPMQSIYRWQGQVEQAREIGLLVKTTRANYPEVERLILAHHPNEVPEILAVPVAGGLPAYLNWVREETHPG